MTWWLSRNQLAENRNLASEKKKKKIKLGWNNARVYLGQFLAIGAQMGFIGTDLCSPFVEINDRRVNDTRKVLSQPDSFLLNWPIKAFPKVASGVDESHFSSPNKISFSYLFLLSTIFIYIFSWWIWIYRPSFLNLI